MKVYIVLDNLYYDYEGGGASVDSVHANCDGAFARVKKLLPRWRRKTAKADRGEWRFPPRPCEDHYLTIEEHEVE